MKQNNLWIGLVLLCLLETLLFTACEREVVLDIEVQKQLVVFSNFSPDSIFRVHLSTAVSLQENGNQFPMYPENASIQLLENGKFIGNFIFQNRDLNAGFSPNYFLNKKANPGSHYSISVEVPDYPSLSAQSTNPAAISIQDWDLVAMTSREHPEFQGLFNLGLKTQLNLDVPESSQTYFHLIAWKGYKVYEVINSDTIIVDHYLEELLIVLPPNIPKLSIPHESGILFEYPVTAANSRLLDLDFMLELDSYFELKPSVYLEIRSVNEDYYRFHKTVGEQEVSSFRESNLSLQSVLIYNNMEGGIGNFSGYTSARDSLKW